MKQFIRFFNSLPLPNALVVLIMALGIIYTLWHIIFWQPIKYQKTNMDQQIKTLQFEIKNLTLQFENAKKIKQPETLAEKTLFKSNEIPFVLKNLINIRQNLKLLELQVLPSENIPITGSNKTFILNNFSIKFIGTYFSTLGYLSTLEKEKIPFYWESLSYNVTKYPYAEVTVNLHVLSY